MGHIIQQRRHLHGFTNLLLGKDENFQDSLVFYSCRCVINPSRQALCLMDLSVVQTLGGRVEEDASGGVRENAQDGWHRLSIKQAHSTPTPGFNAWVRSRRGKDKGLSCRYFGAENLAGR